MRTGASLSTIVEVNMNGGSAALGVLPDIAWMVDGGGGRLGGGGRSFEAREPSMMLVREDMSKGVESCVVESDDDEE